MNRDDVIDVLSVVAAATRRTIGEADVEIWQQIIGGDDKQLALKAVRDHLAECPGIWLEPGHVHQRVRAKVRDELAREPIAMREARQAELDARLREAIDDVVVTKTLSAAESKPHPNPLTVDCPWCQAKRGNRCVVPRTTQTLTGEAGWYHPSRIELVGAGAK